MKQDTIAHYAVLGNPIAHSKSPRIHQLFAEQTGQHIDYQAILVPETEFQLKIHQLFREKFQGMNVTLPFKQEAFVICHACSERAKLAGAVNTLIRTETGWYGENTDGVGLVNDLTRLGVNLAGKQVLLLGAGGAARGVIRPLLEAGVDHLTIANRNVDKARLLADRAEHLRVNGCGYDVVPAQGYDVVINATSASISGDLPPLKPAWFEGAFVYDMMYAKQDTVFLHTVRAYQVAQVADGLGMLVEQAAEAFFLWRGVRPDTAPVLAQLRAELT